MLNGDQNFTYCQDLSGCMLGLGLLWALPACVVASQENMAAMLKEQSLCVWRLMVPRQTGGLGLAQVQHAHIFFNMHLEIK